MEANDEDSPLSSKVAMFNNQANQVQQSQLLNPFSSSNSGRASPKPTFSKDEYGKPLAGSMTEMRGQKANMHVLREMLELCQIINTEGYNVKDEPKMRVITFGELFNIYNYISDKVVGILLRARKYKYVEFEGEMLFQRRDDDVPIFLLRPIQDIRQEIETKIEGIKRATSPAPLSTSLLLDKGAHQQKLQENALNLPDGGSGSKRNSKSRSPSPATSRSGSKAASPAPEITANANATENIESATKIAAPTPDAVQISNVANELSKLDVNNNSNNKNGSNVNININELPTIVIEPNTAVNVSSENILVQPATVELNGTLENIATTTENVSQ